MTSRSTSPLPEPATHDDHGLGGRAGERDGAVDDKATPPLEALRRRADFVAANAGLRVARPGFVLLVRRDAAPSGAIRYGITVSKRVGNAVVRNRMKRRFRALLRELLPAVGIAGADHVVIGREGGIERHFALLREELASALTRAAAGKGDRPRTRSAAKPRR